MSKKCGTTTGYRQGCRCDSCREAHRVDAFQRRRAKYGPPKTPQQRFWVKVERTEDCWLWTASCDSAGYGLFRVDDRTWKAHRWIYEQMVGPIPDGLTIDHLCHVRECVNPAHMEPVTARENTQRAKRNRTHCRRGHEYTPDNIYWARCCKACYAARKEEVA